MNPETFETALQGLEESPSRQKLDQLKQEARTLSQTRQISGQVYSDLLLRFSKVKDALNGAD